MVLLVSIVLGLAAGLARAWKGKRPYQPQDLKYPWLVLVGFAPQFLAFNFRPTEMLFSNWASVALISSQLLLLAFVLVNLKKKPFWALGLGLLSNFIVILLNGGLMPIQPEVVKKLIPGPSTGLWAVGERLLMTKDFVLPLAVTRLWFLDDRFILPTWMNYPVAFSVGDVFIAIGAFWLLWSLGGPNREKKEISNG
jgi:Family of unknown function (DUF5317)